MLSFHITNSDRIEMVCDDEGLATLKRVIENIRGTGGHAHLKSAAGGGHDLDEKNAWGQKGVSELVITWAGD